MHKILLLLSCSAAAVCGRGLLASTEHLQRHQAKERHRLSDAIDSAAYSHLVALLMAFKPATMFASSGSISHFRRGRPTLRVPVNQYPVMIAKNSRDEFNTEILSHSRRSVLGALTAMALLPLEAWSSSYSEINTPAPGSDACISGVGKSCEKLAGGNQYILDLQAQTRAQREERLQVLVSQNAMQLGSNDYFDVMGLNIVENASAPLASEGRYQLLDAKQYWDLRKAGKIRLDGVDQIVDPEAEAAAEAAKAAAKAAYKMQDGDLLSYDDFRTRLANKQVKSISMQQPKGLGDAEVVVNDKKVLVSLDKPWKRQEVVNLCASQKIPNNL